MMTNKDTRASNDRVRRDLRALGRLDAHDEAFGRDLRARLLRQARDIAPVSIERTTTMAAMVTPAKGRFGYWPFGLRTRLISIATAVLLILGGDIVLNVSSVRQPTPVSAQTVLRYAVAALTTASPDEVVHVMSTHYYGDHSSFGTGNQTLGSGPITVTIDQLTQYTATGAISQQMAAGTTITGTLLFRMVQTGQLARIYGTRSNIVEEFGIPQNTGFSWADNTFGVAPQQLVLAARQNALPHVRLLPEQKLDGVTVYVVESSYADPAAPGVAAARMRSPRHVFRLYIDAQNYTIQGMDALEADPGATLHVVERMRVTKRETAPLSSLPADAFALNAPTTARVVHSPYDLLTIAAAVTRPNEPAPLLSNDAEGLRLQTVTLAHAPQPVSLMYYYQSSVNVPGASDNKVFTVTITSVTATTGQAPQSAPATSPISLTVAGVPVRATFVEPPAHSPGMARSLTYRQGDLIVQLAGVGLSKNTFFATVRALVDGHTRPDVAAALQHELDTP